MGIFDVFKGKQYKEEVERLSSMITPEMQDALRLKEEIEKLSSECADLQAEKDKLTDQIAHQKEQLTVLTEEAEVQDFGLYRPTFAFTTSEQYKDRLSYIRDQQKFMIKNKTAVSFFDGWTVDGSKSKGKKMTNDMTKLLLRAFNVECDEAVAKVRYTNYDASLKRILKSAEAISKLGEMMRIHIQPQYIRLKEEELRLAFEYQQIKQQEKEEAREARAAMREAAKLQKEIEEQRKRLDKEQTHYQTAYEKLLKQLESNPDDPDLLAKKTEIEAQLSDIEKSLKDIDYREANQRAGYVYVISNIGSFGEGVYKIGMTRRLEPMDRVDELGDASVPFNFDVHAMIFSDDAPGLEAALHRAFEDRKVNMVNHRREFFRVSLDEIKAVVRENFDKTVEFIDVPNAEQYRVSEKMRSEYGKG